MEGENVSRNFDITKTEDGGFIIPGSANNALTAATDAKLIKFDSSANIEWVGIYGASSTDVVRGVAELADGGYIATG